jgi:hypothetical protein
MRPVYIGRFEKRAIRVNALWLRTSCRLEKNG